MGKAMLRQITDFVAAFAALGAAVIGFLNMRKIQDVHVSINSRMDQLLKERSVSAHAEGIEQGRSDAQKDK